MIERIRLFEPYPAALPKSHAIGRAPKPQPTPLSRIGFAEDLLASEAYVKKRLAELADYFAQRGRPRDGEPRTYATQEFLSEEVALKSQLPAISHAATIAPNARDDKRKAAFLDAETDRQMELRRFFIRKLESSGSFRQAKVHRLALVTLRGDIRKEFFR